MTRRIQGAALLAAGALLMTPVAVAGQAAATPAANTAAKPAAPAVIPSSVTEEDIAMLRADLRAQRKQFVAANMTLTADEATRFWPLFDRYTDEVRKINDKRWAMMKDYAATYAHMTDEQARSHRQMSAETDAALIALRVKFMPEFEKVVSPKKTAVFYQLDRRLDLLMNLQLTSLLPVIQPAN